MAPHKSDAYIDSRRFSVLKTWFKLLSGWTTKAEVNFNSPPPLIESSFTPEEELKLASHTFNLRQFTGSSSYSLCSCVITYTTLESLCGRTCSHTTEFSVCYYTQNLASNSSHTTSSSFIIRIYITIL